MLFLTLSASNVGGSLRENSKEVKGLNTFPALCKSGIPSEPIKVKVGSQVLLI